MLFRSFKNVKKQFKNVRFHSCNSAALFRHSEFDEDIARVGIAAYGCLELPSAFDEVALKPVLSLYASKISSRVLKKGQAIGYGAMYSTQKDELVSTYDFGYGDGFLRMCSNNFLTPNGNKLLGRVSMDNASFIGNEENLLIFNDARIMAKAAKTISYEVLTSLKKKLKREVI